MTYASILVHVQSGPEAQPRLACATELATLFDATLIGIAAELVPPIADGMGGESGDYWIAMRTVCEEHLAEAKTVFHAATGTLGKPAIWESGLRMPGLALAAASRAADLLVASATPWSGKHQDAFRDASAVELVMSSGRPVLVVPGAAKALSAKKVVLAWKDAREARRAMADAMPFFKRADEVLVLEVRRKGEAQNAEIRTDDVVAALQRHGVKAVAKTVEHTSSDGETILAEADAFGADLIVAGAYGHSRLGEWAFGGVTRDLLLQDSRYVLLSH